MVIIIKNSRPTYFMQKNKNNTPHNVYKSHIHTHIKGLSKS